VDTKSVENIHQRGNKRGNLFERQDFESPKRKEKPRQLIELTGFYLVGAVGFEPTTR
jgi:hypothetical protein